MNIIRKSAGTILILGALAGCAGDDGAPIDTATPPSPGQSPSKTVGTPPPVKIQSESPKLSTPSSLPVTADPPAAKKTDEPPKVEGPKTEAPKTSGAAAKLSADDLAGIKELPQAEQAAAIAQVVCPVSTENLGGMGKPLKVTAEGRTFYLCCKNCEKDVKADPKAVLAKLDKLKTDK